MLNSETKRKIDSARNILVGNVTNPISQVDQITNALIYKFMDDMDQENLDVDLEAQFFVGDYAKYSWTKLLDKKLSGQERMNLYMQATESMSKNPHIPQLFRDIFKGAFLPYNDPRVLTLFLKEIDGFSYSHSEELGNAFEYLLSILGSQGDAGQFRTPRHIIDFIVEAVDPKKNETILDPACGTAGFLISAYKHILKNHDGMDNKTGKLTNKEKNLTPDEKTKLMNNVVGYDVDPGMVKLSLVNLYLHGFPDPKIHKYNTLADEKRWDEQFDVIMANPPFMTPKGGVETHKRFSIQANRSEVLFVDYIMDHLSIKGRAGIIVPEGIIFKGDKAYKALRKKLVEDGLFAVVSLPAGVFQPYSGVKTSILLFDNQVAKQTDEMLFVKIENDGFDLGAQRRPIEKSDLPKALEVLEDWKQGKKKKSDLALWVKKEKIAESGDYNLTGERYREVGEYKNQKWEMVELGEIFIEIKNGKNVKQFDELGKYKVSRIQTIADGTVNLEKTKYTNDEVNENDFLQDGDILFSHINSFEHLAKTAIFKSDQKVVHGINLIRLRPDKEKINPDFVLSIFKSHIFINNARQFAQKAVNQASINTVAIKKIKIPLPPLEVQKEIVEQIEVKQNAINHAKEIIKNLERERRYFGRELRKLEGVEMVELGEVAEVISGQSPESKFYNANKNGLPFYQGKTEFTERFIGEPKTWTSKTTKKAEKDDILMSIRAPVGPVNIATQNICIGRGIAAIRPSEKIEQMFLFYFLKANEENINGDGGAVFDSINRGQIEQIKIPLPPLAIQKQLVAEAEKEEEVVVSNRRLIDLMERKIDGVLNDV